MYKYKVKYIGISKICYAYNLEQAFQEAEIFGLKRGLSMDFTIEDTEEFTEKPPYFGIYNSK